MVVTFTVLCFFFLFSWLLRLSLPSIIGIQTVRENLVSLQFTEGPLWSSRDLAGNEVSVHPLPWLMEQRKRRSESYLTAPSIQIVTTFFFHILTEWSANNHTVAFPKIYFNTDVFITSMHLWPAWQSIPDKSTCDTKNIKENKLGHASVVTTQQISESASYLGL